MTSRFPKTLAAAALATGALLLSAWADPSPWLVWNATPSVPVGLYAVRRANGLGVGHLVVVRPPERLAAWLAEGGYLPRGVPLIKRVAALPGQTICRDSAGVVVDGAQVAGTRERDVKGRPLPLWLGCRRLAEGEVLLLNWDEPDSLDGRYFGPTPRSAVLGRARPLWTADEP